MQSDQDYFYSDPSRYGIHDLVPAHSLLSDKVTDDGADPRRRYVST